MGLLSLMLQVADERVAHAETLRSTFGVDWQHLTAQIVSFTIVCALLYWFAYKPVLTMLEARRHQIAQGLANTEKINAALAAIEAQRQDALAAARDEAGGVLARARRGDPRNEAARLIAAARGAPRRVEQHETQRAIAAAEQIVIKARDAAALEHARMMN